MKFFLDFDDVIFNTRKFREDLLILYLKKGITRDEFEGTFIDRSRKIENEIFVKYSLEKQLEKLEQLRGDLGNLPDKVKNFMSDLRRYVFKDFWAFSSRFGKDNVFIVSFGNTSFQRKKIQSSGVVSYISEYRIIDENKAFYIKEKIANGDLSTKERVFLIDDRPEQLELAKKEMPILEILRMRRISGRYNNLKGNLDIQEVANFDELAEIVNAS